MRAQLPQLKRERASDSVLQILRDSILTQVFRPGERLNVKALAEKLGVSLTPVKDAINRLATEGLIEIRPRSGTYVSHIVAEDLVETFEIRSALECLAAEKALPRLTPEVVENFKELIADLEKPVTTEKERLFHERKNVEFHNLIVELSGNRKLTEIYRSLNAHIKIARIHYSREGWAQRMEKEEKGEHREILRAIETRNQNRLTRALRHHIQRASQCLVEDLKKNAAAK